MKLASCKSALNPPVVYSTHLSKAVVPVLVLLFLALWFILRGDLLYVFPCVILFLCFSVLLVLRLPRLGKRELILVLFVRLFDLCLFGFVGFLFLLGSGKGCGLWLWHSLDFSLTFFSITKTCLYIFYSLKPLFYIVKLGFTGVYVIFLISAQKHKFGYSLEPPRRGGSNEYPQSMFWIEIWKISGFYLKMFSFLVMKFSIYLNRRVFIMSLFAFRASWINLFLCLG